MRLTPILEATMSRILVAEDEADLNDLIAGYLRRDGHDVVQVLDGAAAVRAIDSRPFDLLILDWMLPKLDGIAVCTEVRRRHLVPILMLTARSQDADMLTGLGAGADDYVTKPFRMTILRARVAAILRRAALDRAAPPSDRNDGAAHGFTIDRASRGATAGGVPLDLTPTEFELLALLVEHPGRVFSRDYLLQRLWADDPDVGGRTVDTHMQRLRRKLGDHAGAIKTVWGMGYRLQPGVPA
jgi:DNA-binding response OmpR family regulator